VSYPNVDLVTDALRELGVLTEIQTASAEQGEHALRKLNQMMAEWHDSGIDLGYFDQTVLSDACPIPQYAENGVMTHLAARLAANYGQTVSTELAASLMAGYDMIVRIAVSGALPVHTMQNRPCGEADRFFTDITSL
jgi:hypothetical protein